MATLTGKTIASTYDQLWFRGTTEPSADDGAVQVLTTENDGTDDLGSNLYLSLDRVGIGVAAPAKTLEISSASDATIRVTSSDAATDPSLILYDGGNSGTLWYDRSDGILYLDNSYNDAAGDIRFRTKTAGTAVDAMTIDGAGSVGIGTAAPATQLHLLSTTDDKLRIGYDTTNYTKFEVGSNGNLKITTVDSDGTDGDIAFMPDGNVGIGTSSPTEVLSVISAAGATRGVLEVKNTSDNHAFIVCDSANTSAGSGLGGLRGYWDGTEVARVAFESGTDTTNKDDAQMTLYTRLSGSAIAAAMTLNSSQNVGIGDSNPDEAKLSITGVLADDYGLKVVQDQNTEAVYIDNNGTNIALSIENTGSTGAGLNVYSNINASMGSPLVDIHVANSLADESPVRIINDGVGSGITVLNRGTGIAAQIDNDLTATTSGTYKGLHIDFDQTGITADAQTATNIGLDLDMNCETVTMVGTVNNTGIDLDMVAATSGTQTNTGVNIAVSGADTNYALVTLGGRVGVETVAPGATFQVGGTSDAARYFRVNANGLMYSPDTYGNGMTGTLRAMQVQSDGEIGYDGSSRRFKINIEDLDNNILSFLNELNPVTFNFRKKDEDGNLTNEPEEQKRCGLIAEDVRDLCKEHGLDDSNYWQDGKDGEADYVHYPEFIIPLLKAVQELTAKVEALENA